MLTPRPAATPDDLLIATDLVSAAWWAGSPLVAATPAAIEWWHALSFPDDLGAHLRLWYDGQGAVAWSWHDAPEVEWHVWTGDPVRDVEVFRAIVEAVVDEARGGEAALFAAEDDAASVGILAGRGFRPSGRRLSQWQRRPDHLDEDTPALPAGYRIRPLAGRDEFPARVALHRAAFPTSTLTVAKYERLLTVPHYRFEGDLVVEGPDGSLAAFALCWSDPQGGVAEFEPVGTHPDHRRLGLARALVATGLRRAPDERIRLVQVYSDAGEAAAEALYASVGFRRRAFHQRFAIGTPPTRGNGTIAT